MLGTGALSLLGAGVVASVSEPDAGDISLVNSAALWSAVLSLSAVLIAQPADFSQEDIFLALVLGSDAGLLAGSIAAPFVDMSRGRVWLIDVAGLAGFFVSGIFVAAVADEASTSVAGVGLGLGTLGGLALGVYATRDRDKGRHLRPAPRAAGFELAPPSAWLAPHQGQEGERGVIYGVHLLQGSF